MRKAIFGNGGHAREVISLLPFDVEIFVDDDFVKSEKEIPLSSFDPEIYEIMICVGDSQERKKVVDRLPAGTRFFSFIHPSSIIVGDKKNIGTGTFIGPYCFISCNTKIGNHCVLNRGCHVGHDSILGDCVSMMSNSVVSGNCVIGEECYMGNNSAIREKISLCGGVKIGMNSAVVKNIDTTGNYAGVPAKILNKIKK